MLSKLEVGNTALDDRQATWLSGTMRMSALATDKFADKVDKNAHCASRAEDQLQALDVADLDCRWRKRVCV